MEAYTGLEADLRVYKATKNNTNSLMNEARKVFFKGFIEDNSTDQKKLFLATKTAWKKEWSRVS